MRLLFNLRFRNETLKCRPTPQEADAYFANYELTEENEKKAERFAEIIISLIENEEELYRIVRENGDEIEWD